MVKADNTTITGPDTLKGANARVCSVSGSTPAKTIEHVRRPGEHRAVRRLLQVR